jgi:acylphosphatase
VAKAVKTVGFEVFGKVQGVFFRKCTKEQATREHVTGWIRNTDKKTVQGELQGTRAAVSAMKKWLQTKGSPRSRIERAEFVDVASATAYSSFEIVK